MEKNKDRVILLDSYTSALLIEKEMLKIDKIVNRANEHNKKLIRKIAIVLGGPLLMFLGGAVLNFLPIFILGTIYSIVGVCVLSFSSIIKEHKFCMKALKIPNDTEEFQKMLEEEIKVLDEKLAETIARDGKINNISETALRLERLLTDKKEVTQQDFYTDTAKLVMSRPISEEREKYYEGLYKQRRAEIYNNPVDETMSKVSRELYDYSKIYKLPQMDIDAKLWNSLFHNVYNVFKSKGLEDKYYDYMADVSRMVYARALVYEKDVINIESFLNELYESEDINKKDIQDILKSIKEESQAKVLNLRDFRKK